METTEKIVEAYCRYMRGWFTISNIKCSGQYEIDLLAIDASSEKGLKRYHIESGVSISVAYSKLTSKPFSEEVLKQRAKKAGQRRTIGYFRDRKFNSPGVFSELKKFGFTEGNYSKIIVTWGWEEGAKRQADRAGIILWDFRDMIKEVAETLHKKRTYFTDDTLRTIQLFVKA